MFAELEASVVTQEGVALVSRGIWAEGVLKTSQILKLWKVATLG